MMSFGSKPFRPDDRDHLFRATLMRPTTKTRQFYSMVAPDFRIDQGAEGTCVGHATANVLLDGPVMHPDFPPFDTVEDAHQWARAFYLSITGDTTYRLGAYPRDAMAELLRRGLVSEYHRAANVEETVNALLTSGPVSFSSPWYQSMFGRSKPLADLTHHYYLRVNPETTIYGYHNYTLTGVNLAPEAGPPFVRMENSWGPTWAENGTARITLDDLAILYDGDSWVVSERAF